MATTKPSTQPSITKTKFNNFKECLESEFQFDTDTVNALIESFCKIMNYDPYSKIYNEKRHQSIKAYRQKLRDAHKLDNNQRNIKEIKST